MKEKDNSSVFPEQLPLPLAGEREHFTRRLTAIYTCPESGKPMLSRGAVMAVAGVGLVGDRYATGKGLFSGNKRIPDGDRQVSLISAEAIALANADLVAAGNLAFAEAETRRNLVLDISAEELNSLVGRRFWIGSVEFEGVELCDPCAWPGKVSGKQRFDKAFKGRGGLRARVINGGELRTADARIAADIVTAD